MTDGKRGWGIQQREMDYERWVKNCIDMLKMKQMATNQTLSGVEIPRRLAEKIFKVDVDERNAKGETLMVAVILYVCDDLKQVQDLNLLVRMGANPNLGDSKNQRTPLMHACLHKKVSAARLLINLSKTDVTLKDRLGNTALMYAALQGEKTILSMLSGRLTKSWSFNAFLSKNVMGKTAEHMAQMNEKTKCAEMLSKTRLRMLQRMHKQLALIHYSAKLRGWKGYNETYRAYKVWQSKMNQHRGSTSVIDFNNTGIYDRKSSMAVLPETPKLLNTIPRAKSCCGLEKMDDRIILPPLI